MRRYKFREAVLTDIGIRRKENQDAYGIAHTAGTSLFVVADGMGGARGGATASAIAINVIVNEAIKDSGLITRPSLKQAVEKANAAIYRRSKDDEELSGMGTTVVALAFVNECAIVAHVGDSRIYRFRDGEITQLTHDHTLVQELVDSGAIPKEEAENHPIAHMLTRSLGPSPQVEVEIQALLDPTQNEDRFLLCSDGLYNLVSDEEIAAMLRDETPEDACKKLVALALERGGTDNVTIEVLEARDIEDEEFTCEYPPQGELRFIFSEGVATPELRSMLEQQAIDDDLDGDTQRGLPAVSDQDEDVVEQTDEEPLLEDVADEALLGSAVASVDEGSAEQSSTAFRLQASLFFVVGLTAGIFGFFLYQYSDVELLSSLSRTSVAKQSGVEPDGKLAQDLSSMVEHSTQTPPPVGELPGTEASSIPSMRSTANDASPEDIAKKEFVAALALPDAPYIQIRDPQIAGMEANRPIVWENEEKKLEQLLKNQPKEDQVSKQVQVLPRSEEQLLTSDERAAVLEEKRQLRAKIADIDAKLRVLGFSSRKEAEELAAEIRKQVTQKSEEIVQVRAELDAIRNEAAKWNSRLDLARGRSAIRLVDEVSAEYDALQPVFEAFSDASERYTQAVEQWQSEPNNVMFATEMGESGRELQQARVALEQRLAEFVSEQMHTIGEKIALLRLREDLLTIQRDQLSRFEGYLRGYTDLSAVRKKELRDAYYNERGEAAERLSALRRQISDSREIELLLAAHTPKSVTAQ